jgi:hypothetical protein
MRKFVGIFFAIAIAAPIGVIAAAPAGAAAAGTTCKSFSGTASFNPTLPKLGSPSKVKSVLTGTGSIGSCSGTVSGGGVRFVSAKSVGENCTNLGTPPTAAIKATEVISWSNGKTSTIAIKLAEIPGNPVTTQAITGTVTVGAFKGLHEKGKLMYSVLNGGCTSSGLSRISFQASGSITIR